MPREDAPHVVAVSLCFDCNLAVKTVPSTAGNVGNVLLSDTIIMPTSKGITDQDRFTGSQPGRPPEGTASLV